MARTEKQIASGTGSQLSEENRMPNGSTECPYSTFVCGIEMDIHTDTPTSFRA
jgi:hypothetical protein